MYLRKFNATFTISNRIIERIIMTDNLLLIFLIVQNNSIYKVMKNLQAAHIYKFLNGTIKIVGANS